MRGEPEKPVLSYASLRRGKRRIRRRRFAARYILEGVAWGTAFGGLVALVFGDNPLSALIVLSTFFGCFWFASRIMPLRNERKRED